MDPLRDELVLEELLPDDPAHSESSPEEDESVWSLVLGALIVVGGGAVLLSLGPA